MIDTSYKVLFVFLLFVFITERTYADTRIIGTMIPGLHQSDFKGVYDKIIAKAIVEMPGTKLENYPPARADTVFASCDNCCISPSNNNPDFYDYFDDVTVTLPFNIAKIYLFTAPGSSPVSDISELRGKVIGTRFAMPYGKRFDMADIIQLPVSELKEHLVLMQTGHIDAFIAYVPDVYHMFAEQGVEVYPHDKEHPFAVHPDALSCKGVPQDFLDNFNRRLKVLQQNGTIANLLKSRYGMGQ